MIFMYIGEHDYYLKSDKNTREITSMLNKHLKRIDSRTIISRREEDAKYGTYFVVHRPYDTDQDWLEKNLGQKFEYVTADEFYDRSEALNDLIILSNETDIRIAVKEYLNETYPIKFIQDEYTHSSLPVRADIFAVSEEAQVITVEIKSDKDTFTRLRKQLEEYDKFSHLLYVAIDVRHLAKFLNNYKTYNRGILVYEDGKLELYSSCYYKSKIDASKLLWRQELLQFLIPIEGNFNKYNVDDLSFIIESVYTVFEYQEICEYLFVNRYLQKSLDFADMIYDSEYKDKLAQIAIQKLKDRYKN